MLQYKGKGKNAYFCVVSIIYTLSHCCDHNMKQKHLLLFTLRGLQSITAGGGGSGEAGRSSSADGAWSLWQGLIGS